MPVIPSKVKHRTTHHHIRHSIGKRHLLDRPNLKISLRQSRLKRRRQLAHMPNAFGICIQSKHLTPLTQQIDKISPIPASRIENPHTRPDIPSQNLIEHIDIDLPELLLNAQPRPASFLIHIRVVPASPSGLADSPNQKLRKTPKPTLRAEFLHQTVYAPESH